MKYQQIFQNVISPKAAMNRFRLESVAGLLWNQWQLWRFWVSFGDMTFWNI
jgi:hypothetical protein